ncbi:MAG TPA: aminoacyl-histidine dipeptidase [Polyangia bacterium]|jgi:dipeptidase D
MASPLENLEPRVLWQQFDAIRQTPRPSKDEERIAAYVVGQAKKLGLPVLRDKAGNVIVRVPATPGHEGAPITVLQGHLDMVCEKNSDVVFDFEQDPIAVRVDGDVVTATGTTLGADNGLGVAAALAVASDPSVVHGPLELLFTVDEETGLTGAANLDGSLLKGRRMINLDTEEDGALYVGCAGGATTSSSIPITRESAHLGSVPIKLRVLGLKGGHSGVDVHENRGNALKLLARAVATVQRSGLGLDLCTLGGGSKHNAIPREAEAVLRVAKADVPRLKELIGKEEARYRGQYGAVDPELRLTVDEIDDDDATRRVMTAESAARVRRALGACPHGVLAMSRDVPGLVETSSNLAVVTTEDQRVVVITSSRSSVAEALAGTLDQVRSVFRLAGADVKDSDGYPGWKPNLASPVLATTKAVFKRLFNKEPHIKAIHAGLECGLIGEKVPDMDMVSIGPQIESPHSPSERCYISTVSRFYELLRETLKELA